jgi:hypothetical protein
MDLRQLVTDLTTRRIKVSFVKENFTIAGDDSAISFLQANRNQASFVMLKSRINGTLSL